MCPLIYMTSSYVQLSSSQLLMGVNVPVSMPASAHLIYCLHRTAHTAFWNLLLVLQVQWLAGELWDAVRARLDDESAELHLYGAYPTHAVQRLHDPVRALRDPQGFRDRDVWSGRLLVSEPYDAPGVVLRPRD